MNRHELEGARVTPLPQPYTGKVHYFRLDVVPRWPVRVHCGEYLEEADADRVTDDLSGIPEELRCKKCWRRKVSSDRSKLNEIGDLIRTAGESGTVSAASLARIIEMRATRAS